MPTMHFCSDWLLADGEWLFVNKERRDGKGPAYLDIADEEGAMQHAKGKEGSKVLRHKNSIEANHRDHGCKGTQDTTVMHCADFT